MATFKPLSFHEIQALKDDLAAAIQDETGKVDSLTFSRVFFFSKTLWEAGTAHDQQCAELEPALDADMHTTNASLTVEMSAGTHVLLKNLGVDRRGSLAARSHVFHERLGAEMELHQKPCWTFLWDSLDDFDENFTWG